MKMITMAKAARTRQKSLRGIFPSRMQFHNLGLPSNALRAIEQMGIDKGGATEEQRQAIAASLDGRDVGIFTGTGSGKTLSYLLPLVSRLKSEETTLGFGGPNRDTKSSLKGSTGIGIEGYVKDFNFRSSVVQSDVQKSFQAEPYRPRAIVLAPSRELCAQITNVAKILAHNCKIRVLGMDGSRPMRQQRSALQNGVDLVIATPGKIQRHRENGHLYLSRVMCLVLDEADALVENDFGDDAKLIVQSIHARDSSSKRSMRRGKDAGKCAFTIASATSSQRLEKLTNKYMTNMVKIFRHVPGSHTNSHAASQSFDIGLFRHLSPELEENYVLSPKHGKYDALLEVLEDSQMRDNKVTRSSSPRPVESSLVFCNTVKSCRAAEHFLSNSGFSSCCYHSEMPPSLRKSSFSLFRDMQTDIMVCTDIAARGLDLRHVRHVVNLDVPQTLDWYIPRAGRTARAGDRGFVTTIYTKDESVKIKDMKEMTHRRSQVAPQQPRNRHHRHVSISSKGSTSHKYTSKSRLAKKRSKRQGRNSKKKQMFSTRRDMAQLVYSNR